MIIVRKASEKTLYIIGTQGDTKYSAVLLGMDCSLFILFRNRILYPGFP